MAVVNLLSDTVGEFSTYIVLLSDYYLQDKEHPRQLIPELCRYVLSIGPLI